MRLNPGRLTVVEVMLTGPEPTLGQTAEDLENRLQRLDLVGDVVAVGLQDAEVRILIDPVLAREYGITLSDVIAAVQRRNVSSTGGVLESPAERRQVVMWSRFVPRDVGETILRFRPDAGALRIRDIARIEQGREDTGLFVHSNGRRGVALYVRNGKVSTSSIPSNRYVPSWPRRPFPKTSSWRRSTTSPTWSPTGSN